MTLFTFKAEDANKEFEYKEGTYLARIQAIELGETSTGQDQFKITFAGDGFGKIMDFIRDNFFGRKRLFQLYTATGIDTTRTDVDTDELVDNWVMIEIAKRKNSDGSDYLYNDKVQYQVANVFSASTGDDSNESEEEDEWD